MCVDLHERQAYFQRARRRFTPSIAYAGGEFVEELIARGGHGHLLMRTPEDFGEGREFPGVHGCGERFHGAREPVGERFELGELQAFLDRALDLRDRFGAFNLRAIHPRAEAGLVGLRPLSRATVRDDPHVAEVRAQVTHHRSITASNHIGDLHDREAEREQGALDGFALGELAFDSASHDGSFLHFRAVVGVLRFGNGP